MFSGCAANLSLLSFLHTSDIHLSTSIHPSVHPGGDKATLPAGNNFGHVVRNELQQLQEELMRRATERVATHTYRVDSYAEMKKQLSEGGRHDIGFFLAPWKDDAANEAQIKEDCRATIRCYPLDLNANPEAVATRKCFYSGEPATHIALFARAF